MPNAPLILWAFRHFDHQLKTNICGFATHSGPATLLPDQDETLGHISNPLNCSNNEQDVSEYDPNQDSQIHVNTLNVVVIAWLYGRRQEDLVQFGFWISRSQSDGGEGSVRHLTSGSWEVTQLLAYDESTSSVYFLSTEEGSTQRHLYRYARKVETTLNQ